MCYKIYSQNSVIVCVVIICTWFSCQILGDERRTNKVDFCATTAALSDGILDENGTVVALGACPAAATKNKKVNYPQCPFTTDRFSVVARGQTVHGWNYSRVMGSRALECGQLSACGQVRFSKIRRITTDSTITIPPRHTPPNGIT